jgi:quercetin dioxygenase-like cupin family protein
MFKGQTIILQLLVIALVLLPAYAQQSQEPGEHPQPSVRFQGQVTFHTQNGAIKQVSVTVRNWSVVGGRTAARFPEQGFLLFHLLAGQVTTEIGGKQQNRKTGDTWTLPAGSSMELTVKREMATMQTVAAR